MKERVMGAECHHSSKACLRLLAGAGRDCANGRAEPCPYEQSHPWPTLAGAGFRNRAARAAFHRNGMDVGTHSTGHDSSSPDLIVRHRRFVRRFALLLTALVTVTNFQALAAVRHALLVFDGPKGATGQSLLLDALNIWSQTSLSSPNGSGISTRCTPPCAVLIPRVPRTSSFLR